MFDLTSSKLLILAVVALIVVGPKDLPALLRTVGYYLGMIRRQANEFRAQFEDAIRETELSELRREVQKLGEETKSTFDDATRSLNDATRSVETQLGDIDKSMSEIGRAEATPPASAEGAAIASTDPGAIEPPAEPALTPPEPSPAVEPVAPTPAEPRAIAETVAAEAGPPPRQGG
jgi:sec-independent protein translocase protein TatB